MSTTVPALSAAVGIVPVTVTSSLACQGKGLARIARQFGPVCDLIRRLLVARRPAWLSFGVAEARLGRPGERK